MVIFEHINYRTYLKEVLVGRAQKNPGYSLRALARHLGVSAPALSQVINGSKNFSMEKAQVVAKKLGLDDLETDYFRLLVELDKTKNTALKEIVLKKIQSLNPKQKVSHLTIDMFRVISDWYHFAIMAMTETVDFDSNPSSIAKTLGITKAEVDLALERLLRLEMLVKNSEGHLAKPVKNPRVEADQANEALRKYHSQTLGKAIESLTTQTPQEKIVGSETIAIDSRDIEEYRRISEDFFNRVLALAEKSKSRDEVYHLGVQFFKFTNVKEKLK